MNRILLRKKNAFVVGSTVNACTKGLWIWPELLETKQKDGSSLKVLLVDTEGVGATNGAKDNDVKIFLLSMFLSSYLIYNNMNTINEQAIGDLSLMVGTSLFPF